MSEDDKTRPMVQAFPATTSHVMEFYRSEANDEEKEIVAKAIQGASKIIATSKKGDQPKPKKSKLFGLPSPEEVASALYNVLSETPAAKVSGKPSEHGYTKTLIEGQFDLNDVARKLLSLGKRGLSTTTNSWL